MESLSTAAIKRLAKEAKLLLSEPIEGFCITINEEQQSVINASLEGPVGTPYENGLFHLRLNIPPSFPNEPPKGHFVTKIFHPNVSTQGEICVNVLKKDWNSEMTIRHVLQIIRCLLIDPAPDSALNEEAGKLLIEDYAEYARLCKLMTSIHAKKPVGPLTASGANAGSQSVKIEESPNKKAKSEPAAQKDAVNNKTTQVKKLIKRL